MGVLSLLGPETAHGGMVTIEAEAGKWSPVSVSAGADAQTMGNRFKRRIQRSGSGEPSDIQVSRRVYPGKKGRLVVFSVFPSSLKNLRKHLELRCLVADGILDKASIVAVSVDRTAEAKNLDSVQLRGKGISYEEEPAAGGRVFFAALSDDKDASSFSAGEVKAARFSDPALGVVSFAFTLGARDKAGAPYDAALAAKLAEDGFTVYEGPFGSFFQIPPGYTASSIAAEHPGGIGLLFHPKGTKADPALAEAVRFEAVPLDNPATGKRESLGDYKARFAAMQGKGSIQTMQRGTRETTIYKQISPFKAVEFGEGRKAIYFFSTSGEETFTPPAGKRSNFLALTGLFRDGP